MLYIKSFNSYEEFKSLFGITEHGNGAKSRKNRILLSLYKDKAVWKKARELGNYYPFTLADMASLKNWLIMNVEQSGRHTSLPYRFKVMDYEFRSATYETDSMHGICEDGDHRCIRYVNHGNDGRIFKMKAGRIFTKLVEETPFGQMLNGTLKIWLAEEFNSEWQTEIASRVSGYSLLWGSSRSDFDGIYGGFDYDGADFGSCMMDEEQAQFYYDSVDATAAWLENEDGVMVARCVIYNDVRDGEGNKWRLAERQYAAECNDDLKRILVLKLIEAGLIDGFKSIGAGCSDSRSFVDNDGHSLANKLFRIGCSLSPGDTLSYQDSFKWYDMEDQIAYNFVAGDNPEDLATTDDEFHPENLRYDDYHERYCRNTVDVHYDGIWIRCDEDDLDDFCLVPSRNYDYYHEDEVVFDENRVECILLEDAQFCEYDGEYHYSGDCVQLHNEDYALEDDCCLVDGDYYLIDDTDVCPHCGERFVKDDGEWSELLEERYCCEDCLLEAEEMQEHARILLETA